MLPAHPPLPRARNFPFQLSAGIHNSISICESDVGVSVAATLQCAGIFPAAATNSAFVIVTFLSERDFNCSHAGCCCANSATRMTPILSMDLPS